MKEHSIQSDLNKIDFIKCENIKMGDVLHYCINEEHTKERYKIIRILKNIFLKDSYKYINNGRADMLALCSGDYNHRPEHKSAFKNVVALTDNNMIMICDNKVFCFSQIKYISLFIKWVKQLKSIFTELDERLYYSGHILKVFVAYNDWQNICKKNNIAVRLLMTYCDVMPVDSYFTQKFNNDNKMTITLQHGTFNINNNSWGYLGSRSTYFLAESQAAKDTAIEAGYKGNMIVAGSPHHLGDSGENKEKVMNSIGVVMNSPMQPIEDNLQMLKLVQDYCKQNNKKLYIKWHPADDNSKYLNILDKDNVYTYGTEISIDNFCSMMEIVVVSASTSFLTAIKLGIPTFLFIRKENDINLFPKTDYVKFSNIKELEKLISEINTEFYNQKVMEIKQYLIGTNNLKENYRNIINKIRETG